MQNMQIACRTYSSNDFTLEGTSPPTFPFSTDVKMRLGFNNFRARPT